jgi:RNA polymerase sigma-70 factor (ECF subfamily)
VPASDDTFDYEAAIEACARGERFALRALYDHEGRRLLAVALRIVRSRETAQEVLQESMLSIWQNAASYQRRLGSGRGWLYTVVRHKALDRARKRTPEVTLGDDFAAVADADAALHDDVPLSDGLALHRCLEALDERKRECIVGAFVGGFTHDQISTQLAVPVGTVKSWIRRGLLSLRECLG